MEIAELPQPNHKIIVKVLMTQRTDIDRFAEPKIIKLETIGFATRKQVERWRKNKLIAGEVFDGPGEINQNIAIMQRGIKKLNMLAKIEKFVRLIGLLLQRPFVVMAVKNASFGLDMSILEGGSQQLHFVAELGDLLENPAVAARIVLEDGAMKFLGAEAGLTPAEKEDGSGATRNQLVGEQAVLSMETKSIASARSK